VSKKSFFLEFWAMIVVAVIAFVVGLVIGGLGGSSKTEVVKVASAPSSSSPGAEEVEPEPAGEAKPMEAVKPEETAPAKEAKPEAKAASEGKAGAKGNESSATPAAKPAPKQAAASKLAIEADPVGNLEFTKSKLTAKAGRVEIDFTNMSPVPHNVAIEANGKTLGETEVLTHGSDSATVNLKPGTYTYFCTIPGHREAGMEGTLTVK
jgi:plastocyanin